MEESTLIDKGDLQSPEAPGPSERVRRSLRYSIWDGAFYATMVGFGESLFVAFAVFLKANNIQLGVLGSLPQTLGSIVQLVSERLILIAGSRKRMVCALVLLQALMHAPIALVYYMGRMDIYWLIFFVSLYWTFGMLAVPAWNSWMGDLTEDAERGRYFGRRSAITGSASFVSMLASGMILKYFTSPDSEVQYAGFLAVFGLAMVSRLLSFAALMRKHEPPYEPATEAAFGLRDFLREARLHNYGMFIAFAASMSFAVFISAPFFTPFILKDLGMDYMAFAFVTGVAVVVKFLSMPVWGRITDRFGTRKVITLSAALLGTVPGLWLVSGDIYFVIGLQVYAGFIWGGFELSMFNFVLDATEPRERVTCVAYFNLINGIAQFMGAITGALIARYNDLFWSKYLLPFLISGMLRLLVVAVFMPRIKEVRVVEHIPYHKLLFEVITTMPTMGLIYRVVPMVKRQVDRFR